MNNLKNKKCVACEGGVPPLARKAAENYLKELSGWKLSEDFKKISRDFEFNNFKEAMNFVYSVASVAESENHHPDIFIHSYKKVIIALSTHAIGGLSKNDFIIAAKIDALLDKQNAGRD